MRSLKDCPDWLLKRHKKRKQLVFDIFESLKADLDDVPDVLSTITLLFIHSLSMCNFPVEDWDLFSIQIKKGLIEMHEAIKKDRENEKK